MNEKPHFDRAIVCLHATIRYNILDYMDDTSHFNKAIVRLHTTQYHITYHTMHIYDKPVKQFCIILYAYVSISKP